MGLFVILIYAYFSIILRCSDSFSLKVNFLVLVTGIFTHRYINIYTDDPVAARFEVWAVSARAMDRVFESLLGYGCLSPASVCFPALYRHRPCVEPVARARCRTVRLKSDQETITL
jgi:hypothetical protein